MLDLIIRLWPKVRGYHPEVIVRHKDGPDYLDVADADDKDSEDKITLLPQGELPSKPKLKVAILDLVKKLKSLDEDKSWAAVNLEDVKAVEAEMEALIGRLGAEGREHWCTLIEPSVKRPRWVSLIEKNKNGKSKEVVHLQEFDSQPEMVLWTIRQLRRALVAPQDTAKNDHATRESAKKDTPKKDTTKDTQFKSSWVRSRKK